MAASAQRISNGPRELAFPQITGTTAIFLVESHPAVLDGFVTQYCKAYQALGLFGPEHCHPDSFSSLDYEGKVLVLSPDILKESLLE